jgi:TLC ATP/ADP transporter
MGQLASSHRLHCAVCKGDNSDAGLHTCSSCPCSDFRSELCLNRVATPVQLANILSTEKLFYACIIPFIIFFGAFAFVLYPMREALHPTGALM